MPLVRQHLIDPEICIRCNTCEEICPVDAITHDGTNYVVEAEKCDACGDCLPPCPTGAIDSWRQVNRPWSITDQFGWDSLPDDEPPEGDPDAGRIPEEVARQTEVASAGSGGREVPPFSAAHPYVNAYTRERPAIATVQGNYRLTAEGADSDIRHLVLDFGKTVFPVLEGQSVGVIPPGVDEAGNPHHVRLYSVASPRQGERSGYNNIALTIKRVVEDEQGTPVHGIASNYMCDLERGAEVEITGPFGTTFLMPNHPGSKIVMVCTGTGAAPFRAMTERRRRYAQPDPECSLFLFFGARRQSDLPYFGPLMKLPKSLIDVELAFSREAGRPKAYVQDRIRARSDDLAALLADPDSYFFICGHKRMENGVNLALAQICTAHGLNWETLQVELRETGRYHVETYY